MIRREFRRVTLADLPELEAEGWRPAATAMCGAIGLDPYSCGLGAGVTVVRDLDESDDETGEHDAT